MFLVILGARLHGGFCVVSWPCSIGTVFGSDSGDQRDSRAMKTRVWSVGLPATRPE